MKMTMETTMMAMPRPLWLARAPLVPYGDRKATGEVHNTVLGEVVAAAH